MKKVILLITVTITASCFAEEPLANEDLQGLYVYSIEQVLRLPPEEIDVGIAALIISESWSEVVAGRRYQQQLDDWAYEIRDLLKVKKIPVGMGAIPVINTYLYDELKFKTIDRADDPHDLFLHTVMDRRRGYCLSLSIVYLAIGERLGLPLYGVVAPGHFFVRYDDGQTRFNIEATHQGVSPTDDYYIKTFNVPAGDTLYMTNLNKLQTLGCFCNNLGNVYKEVANYDQAMQALKCAVYINPTLAESRANLGGIYLVKNRPDDAIPEFQAAIRINPNNGRTHYGLGNAYYMRDWLNDAVSEYTITTRYEPNFVDAYRNLSLTYRRLDRLPEAKATTIQALVYEPKNPHLYFDLAEVYAQSDDYNEAITRYEKAIKLKPDFAEAYAGIGRCYLKNSQPDKAIKSCLKSLQLRPETPSALECLGTAYFAKGNYDSAIEQYLKAINIEASANLYRNLGACYFNKGNFEQAYAGYSKAVELDPKMADAHYQLAIIHYKLRNYDEALKHIKTSQELGAAVDPNLVKSIENRQ
ncbi:MAG: tetratricopeptide repeat protein [Sedimentisphaerales bacterium]|nr:tetratricopeptide repeat protein [Sedimentisphaerales bacterium]